MAVDHGMHDVRDAPAWRPLLGYALGAGLSAAIVYLATRIGPWRGGSPRIMTGVLWVSLSMLPLVAGVVFASRQNPKVLKRSLQAFLALLAFGGIGNRVGSFFEVAAYGDAGEIGNIVANGIPHTRWFLGTAILTDLWSLLRWAVSPLTGVQLDPYLFHTIAGAVVMGLASVVLLERNPGRLRVVLPLLTPIWLLFTAAYDEYYPFIAWAFVVLLLLVTDSAWTKRSPLFVGIFTALFALLYVVYIPVAAAVLVAYRLSTDFKRAMIAGGAAAATVVTSLLVFWRDGSARLVENYGTNLLLGERGVQYSPYVGHMAPNTPFFTLAYTFSAEHLTHLLQMMFIGAGVASCIVLASLPVRQAGTRFWRSSSRSQLLSLLAIACTVAAYFLLMAPKLGPVRDIDLFFMAYVTLAFCAGLLADTHLAPLPEPRRHAFAMTAMATAVGSGVVFLTFLLLR